MLTVVRLIIASFVSLAVVFASDYEIFSIKAQTICMIGPIELPKAPHFDEEKNAIFFADIVKSGVVKYVPGEKTYKYANVGTQPIAFVIPIKGKEDEFIISYGSKVAIIKWDGIAAIAELNILGCISDEDEVFRANYGKVAPSGNLFIGTHSPSLPDGTVKMNSAALYSYNKNKISTKILENVTIANGMAWSEDAKKFYFIDSLANTVESYDYNCTDDSLSNRALLLDYKKENLPGIPDGMAIDKEGKLWVTSWNGTFVARICPDQKTIITKYEFSANKISSAVFANDKLFIMTAKYQMTPEEELKFTEAGMVLQEISVTVGGYPGTPFDIYDKR